MKVDNHKFDKALHHPNFTIKKINKIENRLKKLEKFLHSLLEGISEIKEDLISYRAELLESINCEGKRKGR